MSELNGVMLQAFHWFMKPDETAGSAGRLWPFLAARADDLRDLGIDAVWIPPPYKGCGGRHDVGYGVYDHFDLGEFQARGDQATKYGTRDELHAAINALHGFRQVNGQLLPEPGKRYLQVYADIVLNHKMGGDLEETTWTAIRVEPTDRGFERRGTGYENGEIEVKPWTRFDHPERNGRHSTFRWRARHFDSVDAVDFVTQGGSSFKDGRPFIYRFIYNEQGYDPNVKPGFETWVSLEKGNYDYLTGADLDYARYDVREEMKYWGQWLANIAGFDGFRLDAVKHVSADFVREWLGHVRAQVPKNLLAVGEYIASDVSQLHGYLGRVSGQGPYPQDLQLFDFPLRFKFRDLSWKGDAFDLRDWNRGTLMAEQPAKAVTFVENHDYEWGRDVDSHVREWIKPLAYAYILLRAQGYPVVFFPDLYGSVDYQQHTGQPAGMNYLQLLLQLRKQFALGEERYYGPDSQAAGWVRMGGVNGARGAMAVVINTAARGVRSVRMDTGRVGRRFYHLATMKYAGTRGPDGFTVVRNRYDLYGDKAEATWTDGAGWGDFVADSGTVSVWLEDGVGLV